jgi:hypothetical protein
MAIDKRIPIYRFVVGEDDEAGVTAVALVDNPAIEMNWQAFKSSVNKDFGGPGSGPQGEDSENEKEPNIKEMSDSELDNHKNSLLKKADELSKEKKRLYPNPDITTPMSPAEKELDKKISKTLSDANAVVVEKRRRKQNMLKFSADTEKRIISGPLMVADLPIYRKDEQGEYYGLFTAEDIYNIRNKFFKNNNTKSVNEMHDPNKMIEGVYMIESFIIDSKRGINAPDGLKLTDGSWFGSYKVDNEDIWNDFIKTGEFKGFSVEGVFKTTKIDSKPLSIIEQAIDIIKQIED